MQKPRPKKERLSTVEKAVRKLVTYAEARRILTEKFHASDAEIAVWLFVEQSSHFTETAQGQLNTYTGQDKWFKWNPARYESHNTSRLAQLFFDVAELTNFDPAHGYGRWLSYETLSRRCCAGQCRRQGHAAPAEPRLASQAEPIHRVCLWLGESRR
jgi:hypothetical protein